MRIMRRIALGVAAGLAAISLSGCYPVTRGWVIDRYVEDGRWKLYLQQPVPHDRDARFEIDVPFWVWVNCQVGDHWREDDHYGCRHDPPG